MTFGQTVVKETYEKEIEDSPKKLVDFEEYQEVKPMNYDRKHIHGMANKPRTLEPSMFDLMTGGYEHHVEGDYLKPAKKLETVDAGEPNKALATLDNENNVKYRIKKSASRFITETRDNYR